MKGVKIQVYLSIESTKNLRIYKAINDLKSNEKAVNHILENLILNYSNDS